ncbi:MAG: hypothetical protein H6741_31440 [Alphaproteobacteria bacterium]|nr:hypothetical protein [Alphaproteobacteria bacterium]
MHPLPLIVLLLPPVPTLFRSKTELRHQRCERLTLAEAEARLPDRLNPPRPRGDRVDRSVMLCAEDLVRPGLRSPRDEAILATLDARATELAADASARYSELDASTWLVEVYHPDTVVAEKVDFATKNALMALGLQVSDRAPRVAVGDVQVLTRMEPWDAYPAACKRYSDNGSMGPEDALLAVMLIDMQETNLHAGLCAQGHWTWLR